MPFAIIRVHSDVITTKVYPSEKGARKVLAATCKATAMLGGNWQEVRDTEKLTGWKVSGTGKIDGIYSLARVREDVKNNVARIRNHSTAVPVETLRFGTHRIAARNEYIRKRYEVLGNDRAMLTRAVVDPVTPCPKCKVQDENGKEYGTGVEAKRVVQTGFILLPNWPEYGPARVYDRKYGLVNASSYIEKVPCTLCKGTGRK